MEHCHIISHFLDCTSTWLLHSWAARTFHRMQHTEHNKHTKQTEHRLQREQSGLLPCFDLLDLRDRFTSFRLPCTSFLNQLEKGNIWVVITAQSVSKFPYQASVKDILRLSQGKLDKAKAGGYQCCSHCSAVGPQSNNLPSSDNLPQETTFRIPFRFWSKR